MHEKCILKQTRFFSGGCKLGSKVDADEYARCARGNAYSALLYGRVYTSLSLSLFSYFRTAINRHNDN